MISGSGMVCSDDGVGEPVDVGDGDCDVAVAANSNNSRTAKSKRARVQFICVFESLQAKGPDFAFQPDAVQRAIIST